MLIRDRLFGFLLGTATAGAGMYYYVIDEYRVSNQLLTEDIYALQSAVQRIEGYVRTLEEKVGEKRRWAGNTMSILSNDSSWAKE